LQARIRQEKKNKRIQMEEGEQIFPVCKKYDPILKDPKDYTKNI
jgi:hypothetical protein